MIIVRCYLRAEQNNVYIINSQLCVVSLNRVEMYCIVLVAVNTPTPKLFGGDYSRLFRSLQ